MEERPSYRQMELRGGATGQQQQQQSPDSTQDSTEVSMEQQQQQQQQHIPTIQVHHHHHPHMASMMALMEDSANAHHRQQHLGLAQDQNPYAAAAAAGSFFQQGGNTMIVQAAGAVKEEPHSQQQQQHQIPVFAMDQLYWAPQDQAQLMEPMSPESADLCRNLTSQLEHFRKELGTYYAESSTNNHHMLEQQQQPQAAAAAAEKTSIIPSPAAAASASDLMGSSVPHSENEMLKAAIVSHPHYPELVAAHMNCHKVGAPPEVVSQIDEIIQNFKEFQPAVTTSIGVNPELDQFMVSYYTMLLKYEKEIKKTFKEAVAFCKKLEQQLQVVTNGSVSSVTSVESDERNDGYDTSEEEDSGAEVEIELDPMAKDKELKEQLMRKYSGYISSLKHEFLKKKKKGKLPKDSRQQLLNWWSLHYKWPYPSESEKASLAESTGLDQKQINNWFINQRKRHWKPSDELTVLGGQPSQNNVPEANSGT